MALYRTNLQRMPEDLAPNSDNRIAATDLSLDRYGTCSTNQERPNPADQLRN
ncbi:hypothetical protein SIPHO041v1_p0133 [Vibrio phage 234P1]|nr:hypothetical protein SIPHO041v1_p0133 [Vibrio phage 234P1]QZI88316.1 hypothetical protein SIPHO082v1_p0039 [Vibrio phage 294E48.1]QZI88769.1 hypothetical protein SIPHO039v1_p0140 [Vibrio phage 70E35.5a]QZI88951.1 hypothetical protein SIPHO040v1_p0138 [Vibrio phage 70E35.6]